VLNTHPDGIVFTFPNIMKPDGINSDEYNGYGPFFISFAARKPKDILALCGCALSAETISL
jgi:hypothetical protein